MGKRGPKSFGNKPMTADDYIIIRFAPPQTEIEEQVLALLFHMKSHNNIPATTRRTRYLAMLEAFREAA